MSIPTSRSATSMQPTRQQLDELEALMQRMLELPVQHGGEVSGGSAVTAADAVSDEEEASEWGEDYPPPPAEWGAVGLERLSTELPISSEFQATEPDADTPAAAWDEPAFSAHSPAFENERPVETGLSWASTEDSSAPENGGDASARSWAEAPVNPLEAELGAAESPPTGSDAAAASLSSPRPGSPRPFLWLNLTYDVLTYLLGPLGRWLRGPAGRALVGWIGVLLLAGAMAWFLYDWMGWTW